MWFVLILFSKIIQTFKSGGEVDRTLSKEGLITLIEGGILEHIELGIWPFVESAALSLKQAFNLTICVRGMSQDHTDWIINLDLQRWKSWRDDEGEIFCMIWRSTTTDTWWHHHCLQFSVRSFRPIGVPDSVQSSNKSRGKFAKLRAEKVLGTGPGSRGYW